MKIAFCQIDTTVGAFEKNLEKVELFLKKASESCADVVVFPELTLSSYPPLDLLDRPDFEKANATALIAFERFLSKLNKCPKVVVLGSILENQESSGRHLQNGAVVFIEGKKAGIQAKRLLPTYDVFDEARYFEPAKKSQIFKLELDSKPVRFGVCVCEDSWFEDQKFGKKIYHSDPADDLTNLDFVINISASPFEMGKRAFRKEMMGRFAKRCKSPLIYVNQTGANDEILFDGCSALYSSEGISLFEAGVFEESLSLVEFDLKSQKVKGAKTSSQSDGEIEVLYKALVTGIRDYFNKTGFQKAVLGLSGGIDSAVVACLAAEALGSRNVIGISMPGPFSSSHSLSDAEQLAKNLNLEYQILSIKFLYSTLLLELKPSFQGKPQDVTEENIQARLRALLLMSVANKRNALVLTTGNKSEIAVGYCTTYGDMVGALAPIGDVFKTKVYTLAKWINQHKGASIPESTLTKPPSAELKPNQKDQDSLPEYSVLDSILEAYIEDMQDEKTIVSQGFEANVVEKVLSLVRYSEFKRRQAAPVLKVTSKAFGLGRRIPVAKSY